MGFIILRQYGRIVDIADSNSSAVMKPLYPVAKATSRRVKIVS
jgi:hypothetical protein